MSERDEYEISRVDAIRQEFRSHLQAVEFGSPDYLAFCDFYALEQQKYNRRIEIKNLTRGLDSADKAWTESRLRITETRIALLENEIDQKKVTDVDYSKAYDHVEETMAELRKEIVNELKAEKNDPEDDGWIHRQSEDEIHDLLINDFRNVLYRFFS